MKGILSLLVVFYLSIYSQEIQIINPDEGDFVPNNYAYITYKIQNDIFHTIEYSLDLGHKWSKIITTKGGGSDNVLDAHWIPPDTISTKCLIRIRARTDSTIGDTSGIFTLYSVEGDTLNTDSIFYNFYNDGSNRPYALHYPLTAENNYLVFRDGLMFGGVLESEIKVVGTFFYSSIMPGKIESDFEDPREFRIWNYKKDWESLPEGKEKEELKYEYENWPVDLGAPFNDENGDGVYTPYTDDPKLFGDEYAWFLMNDRNDSLFFSIFGSGSLGLEISCVTYVYHNIPQLQNTVFRKYLITNKSKSIINDFVIGFWSDFDLGYYNDDYTGCDTTLNLGYGYNANDIDAAYQIPPAIGYQLLQGPVVEGTENDEAYFKERWIPGKRNLDLTSFAPMIRYGYDFFMLGDNKEEWYNNLTGRLTSSGTFPIDPHTGLETKFALAGDPVNEIGWYEGIGWPDGEHPGGRRLMINTGEIDFSSNDTIEVAYAILVAQGKDRLNSIEKLKESARYTNKFYYNEITDIDNKKNKLSISFSLSQNYPNPFNPTTKIKFTIPNVGTPYKASLQTKLIIFDILGKEIKTIINKPLQPGEYEVEFDGTNLPSGVYFYRIVSGNFISTKKMLLLK